MDTILILQIPFQLWISLNPKFEYLMTKTNTIGSLEFKNWLLFVIGYLMLVIF